MSNEVSQSLGAIEYSLYFGCVTEDPRVVAADAPFGAIALYAKVNPYTGTPIGTASMFQKQDNGLSTNWIPYGDTSLLLEKDAVQLASTANIPLAGAFPFAVDGVVLTAVQANYRILLKNQGIPSQNGIYVLNDAGAGNYTLTRSADANSSAEVRQGLFTWAVLGATNSRTGWLLNTPNPIILDTTALNFIQTPMPFSITPLANYIYVDKSGNDITGNGSIDRPYLTVQKAATVIGGAISNAEFNDATKRYYTVKVGPGLYVESVIFGTRPFIRVDLESSSIQGNVTVQFDQGAIFGAGLQSPQFILRGDVVRSVAGGTPTIGIVGNLIYESIGSGSSLVALLENIGCAVQGNVVQQLGAGGGVFTLTHFVSSGIITGSILNNTLAGSHTLYVDNSDDSSSNSIGAVNGVVNLNILSNVRFNGAVVISGAQSGRWFDVEFKSGQAHNFTGALGAISADANSYQSYFANVPVKGAETFILLDNARGVAYPPAIPANWSPVPADVKAALDQLAASGALTSPISGKFITLTVNGGTPTYYSTIQAAINAIPLPANAADELKFYNIYIPSGNYDESLVIGPSRNISLIGLGTVILGSGSLANHGSVTPRNITWTVDQTFEFSFSRPTLRILTIEPDEASSTHTAYSGGFIISGSLVVANEGLFTSHELHLDGVKIFGTITKGTLGGLLSTYMRKSIIVGAITCSNMRIQIAESTEFGALVSIGAFNRIMQCEFVAGLTVTASVNDLPPSGMFFTTFSGTFTGPAGSAKFDAATDYYFTTNGALLAGGATKVRIALASGIGFTPAVAGNWIPVPTEVKGALDTLASDLKSIKSSFVFQPGGVAGPNVYTTWATLYAAISGVKGLKTVLIDETFGAAHVTAGAYDLSTVCLYGLNLVTFLIFDIGATISGLYSVEQLGIASNSTAAVWTIAAGAPASVLNLKNRASIVSNLSPFFVVPAGATLNIRAIESSHLDTAPAIGCVNIAVGGTLNLLLHDSSLLLLGSLIGSGTATVSYDDSSTLQAQAAFLGILGTFLISHAEKEFYAPGVPANWPIPPSQVAGALDSLAARQTSVQYISLSAGQIAAKQIVVAPNPRVLASTRFRPQSGSSAFKNGPDFVMIGPNIISWAGLTLDGFFTAGDEVVVEYDT